MNAFPSADFGRPSEPSDRVAAYAACLASASISASCGNLRRVAFWDESLSASAIGPVGSVGFVRTLDGPCSDVVASVVRSLRLSGGLARNPSRDPEASEALRPSEVLLARGAKHLLAPWGTAMLSFVDGLVSGAWRVGMSDDTADVALAMEADPTYRSDDWEGVGPGGVRFDLGAIHPSLAGAFGNGMEAAMRLWIAAASESAEARPTPDMAATAYGMFLAEAAARSGVDFGDARMRALARDVTVSETRVRTDGRATVRAEFLEDGIAVAWAEFEPRVRVEESFAGGRVERVEEPDGTLVHFSVAPGARGRGLGALAVRHAVNRGCVRSHPPTAEAGRTLSRHGNPRPDGGYDLCRIEWPRISTVEESAGETGTRESRTR